jgi:hypothetical protein
MRHVYYCNDVEAQGLMDDRSHLWEMMDSDFGYAEVQAAYVSAGT